LPSVSLLNSILNENWFLNIEGETLDQEAAAAIDKTDDPGRAASIEKIDVLERETEEF